MAEEITEIPLDNTDIPEEIGVEDIPETIGSVEDIPPEEPTLAAPESKKARAKGRPAGAKNKAPAKPRPKKVTIQPIESPPYEPSSPRRNLKIPSDPNSSDIAAAMLKLLQDQTHSRQSRKQRLYSSWFQ